MPLIAMLLPLILGVLSHARYRELSEAPGDLATHMKNAYDWLSAGQGKPSRLSSSRCSSMAVFQVFRGTYPSFFAA